MFDVVRGRSRALTRLRPALVVSLLAHAVLLAAAVLLSHPAPPGPPERLVPVRPPRGKLVGSSEAPASPSPAAPRAHRPGRPRPPEQHPLARRPETQPAAPIEPADGSAGAAESGETTGEGPGGLGDGPACATPPCGDAMGIQSEDVVAAMPVLLSAPEVTLSLEARRSGVEGTMLVRCVITAVGSVEGCEVLQGLPLAETAVLAALRGRQYRPAEISGRPVSVRHLFTIKVRQAR